MITDIHAARDVLHAAHRNKAPAREQRTADQRVIEAKRAAVEAFAALNGWRKAESPHFDLDLLGKGTNCNWSNSRDRQLRDHPIWFCSARRFVAAVGQPYLPAVDLSVSGSSRRSRSCLARADRSAGQHPLPWPDAVRCRYQTGGRCAFSTRARRPAGGAMEARRVKCSDRKGSHMGPHPGRKKLIVRTFEKKPGRYYEKAAAKVADAPPLSPPPAAKKPEPEPFKERVPGPGVDRKPGLSVAEQRQRKRPASLLWPG
jgi:hypothetical protein